jgi:hypothetical protein
VHQHGIEYLANVDQLIRKLSVTRRLQISKNVADLPAHALRCLDNAVQVIMGVMTESVAAFPLRQLRKVHHNPQRFLKVVGCEIGELL